MPNAKSSKKSKDVKGGRSRSFGGCATCRIRHMKCDEGRPTCLMCQHFGIACGGYEKNIFFASEQDDDTERFRRPLFTEKEREEMSNSLVSSLPPKLTLLRVLTQIDEESETAASNSSLDIQIHRGPFGAFKLSRKIEGDSILLPSQPLVPPVLADHTRRSLSPSAFVFSPRTQEFFETFVMSPEDIPELHMTTDIAFDFSQPRIEELFGDNISLAGSDPTYPLSPNTCEPSSVISRPNVFSPPTLFSPAIVNEVPKSAVLLLKHYSTTIIGLLTPSKNSKTLWHVLFLPHIKTSLAALSMGEDLDHASLTSFYGTLAISAFHLKAACKSDDWYQEGRLYKQRAREHVRVALKSAYTTPKVSKYKSMLMALLTMVQLSMFDGDWTQTESYLLEAEKLIRLRGLPRRKSRKRRLLHHCYAFMRLLHESLFMMTRNSLQRTHVRLAIESSGLVITGQDSPSFRLSSWRNLVQKMLEVKSPDEGENDLHLENPGFFSATMYPEIYGLPEEWLVMLSQVIRLSNEKEPSQEGPNSLNLREFSVRAKELESCILNWVRPPAELFCTNPSDNNVDERVLRPLLDALHQALIIYFYRRIYDIDASMLQKRVESARNFLQICDEADPGRVRYTAVFIWPAFIAACEAEEADLQLSFQQWFEDSVAQSGQSAFKHMYSIVKQVWQERRQRAGSGLTWLDFMKNQSDTM